MQPSSQKKKKNQMQPMSQLESKLTSHLHTNHYPTCNYLRTKKQRENNK